jgi:hypothetical protein
MLHGVFLRKDGGKDGVGKSSSIYPNSRILNETFWLTNLARKKLAKTEFGEFTSI